MKEFIELLFISSLWIWGVIFIFKHGQIFGCAGDLIRRIMPKWFYKPLIGCPACCASVHGSIIYLLAHSLVHADGFYWPLWIFFIVSLWGLNHIITGIIYDITD